MSVLQVVAVGTKRVASGHPGQKANPVSGGLRHQWRQRHRVGAGIGTTGGSLSVSGAAGRQIWL
ncbi:MAG TPA: hypothetical protein DEF41_06955 [Desulfovibrio sp.]|nr:hypothetical protein [Desulfovibrio sp.]